MHHRMPNCMTAVTLLRTIVVAVIHLHLKSNVEVFASTANLSTKCLLHKLRSTAQVLLQRKLYEVSQWPATGTCGKLCKPQLVHYNFILHLLWSAAECHIRIMALSVPLNCCGTFYIQKHLKIKTSILCYQWRI